MNAETRPDLNTPNTEVTDEVARAKAELERIISFLPGKGQKNKKVNFKELRQTNLDNNPDSLYGLFPNDIGNKELELLKRAVATLTNKGVSTIEVLGRISEDRLMKRIGSRPLPLVIERAKHTNVFKKPVPTTRDIMWAMRDIALAVGASQRKS